MKRVWVTRDESPDGPLCTALRSRGLEPVLEPVIERSVLNTGLQRLADLLPGDWLVLTSPFAINAVCHLPGVQAAQLAVVGEASAKIAQQRGLSVALQGADGHGDTLRMQLEETIHTGTVWHPRSERAKPLDAWTGVNVQDFPLYTTTPRRFDRNVLGQIDLIAVASPSAVQAFDPLNLPIASIGRATTAALAARGLQPVAEPRPAQLRSPGRVHRQLSGQISGSKIE
jgi:uroporphyrinogen-III synthase